MKTTVNFAMFCDSFSETYRNNFSYSGKRALFDYLEQYEEDCGIELECDMVAFCCDFSEYPSAVDCITECGYDCDLSDLSDEDEKEAAALEYLRDRTQVIDFDEGIIIQNF
jgi:hypothetical protein